MRVHASAKLNEKIMRYLICRITSSLAGGGIAAVIANDTVVTVRIGISGCRKTKDAHNGR